MWLYLVQTPDEMAKSLDKAFANTDEPIASGHLMDVLKKDCPVPKEFLADEPAKATSGAQK